MIRKLTNKELKRAIKFFRYGGISIFLIWAIFSFISYYIKSIYCLVVAQIFFMGSIWYNLSEQQCKIILEIRENNRR